MDSQPVPMAKVSDLNGDELRGSLYGAEMYRVDFTPEPKVVDEVLNTRTRNRRKEYYVSYVGYPENWNSWVSTLPTK